MHLLRLRSTALPLLIVAARALIVRFGGDAQEKAHADRLREAQEEAGTGLYAAGQGSLEVSVASVRWEWCVRALCQRHLLLRAQE